MTQKWLFFAALAGCAYALASSLPSGKLPGGDGGKRETLAVVGSGTRSVERSDVGGSGNALVIERGAGGQFHLTAQVEGQDTEFLVDTGADVVALTVGEAERLGYPVDPASFQPLMQTAAGTGNGTVVRLSSFEVAGAEFHDVDAVVMDGLAVNLLGQSVLRRLGQVSLEGDRMTISR